MVMAVNVDHMRFILLAVVMNKVPLYCGLGAGLLHAQSEPKLSGSP
ncbi:hypothetical protein PM3016_4065 [Paenibacillus mucilaginosus 3016]|uniref:Uncharacterized protein n=1 Tax=Paenibacillus mucilaginosus 3016 TaxID=1116391 RepID=H6NJZ6_9BACL|nr:hypothetical protein PM3016_4065 [Paenibacillus mucilaginosus 3016]